MDLTDNVFTRNLELESCKASLTFVQKEIGDVSCVVWDAAIALAKYLDFSNSETKWLSGKKVLELGAGLGCAGLTAACLGANVILSDLEGTLPLLQQNIQINETQWKNFGGSAKAVVLEWGKPCDLEFHPEIVLATDCVYYEESIKPFLDTLETYCNKGASVILSQEERDTPVQILVWETFLTELKSKFQISYIPQSEQHPVYSCSDIHLMRISKRPDS
ncbi:hypothetical protein QAD02_010650 [Eretmocerus hayati]|uniref:Uncharacterized protein n=1 Tax=Eretmocerus hayati TaxID=131215 RepID=A0ACC2NUT3_9HYME|nr:hypothetical protein QAD02_010650 [Eretmocerus hayati]